MVPSLMLWKGVLLIRSLLISFAGFTLCNSNSQMHRLALSHPWVMGVKAAAKKVEYSFWCMIRLCDTTMFIDSRRFMADPIDQTSLDTS